MNSRKNLHAADGSFLGFLFQIERVIQWLSELDVDGVVGIEVDDDIVVKLINNQSIKQIYEQAKHTLRKTTPFSDKSKDLWKTLSIWVKAALENNIDLSKAKFSPLTNKIIPKTRLIYAMHEASSKDIANLNSLSLHIKRVAAKLRKGLKPFGDIIVSCPDETLKQVINSIEIISPDYAHTASSYKRIISKNLNLSEGLPYDDIVDKLFGWITRELIHNWRNGNESWISVKAFNLQYNQLVAAFMQKPFLEKTVDSLPVSKKEVELNKTKTYVGQLTLIECKDDEILEAIHDYYRASTERDRFARDGEIARDKYELYYEDLLDKWKAISRPRFRNASGRKLCDIGYEVYYEVIQYKGKLNNYEPEQSYTYKGAFHHLSNELELGWHPKWKKKFKA